MKKCPECEEIKVVTEFYRDKTRVSGCSVYCKTCHKRINKDNHEKNHGGSKNITMLVPRGLKVSLGRRASKVRKLGIDLVDIDRSRISGYEDIEFARGYIKSL